MLTRFSSSLPSRWNTSSVTSSLTTNKTRITSTPTSSPVSCRSRIKRSKYPLQWVKQKLALKEFRKPTLTLNQYLGKIRGDYVDGFHAPINKKFRKKTHVFNPFVKVDPEITQETCEFYEFMASKKEVAKGDVGNQFSANQSMIESELAALHRKQAERRVRRVERVKEALNAQELQRQAERQERIKSKKQARRDEASKNQEVEDEVEETPSVKQSDSEFVF